MKYDSLAIVEQRHGLHILLGSYFTHPIVPNSPSVFLRHYLTVVIWKHEIKEIFHILQNYSRIGIGLIGVTLKR